MIINKSSGISVVCVLEDLLYVGSVMEKHFQRELVGVIGDPVDDNPSVVIEQAAFDYLNMPIDYLTIRVKEDELEDAVKGIKAMNFKGVNITMPHKMEILKYMDCLSDDAKLMGAVNTVYNKEGILYGENTDGKGFVKSFIDAKMPLENKNVFILGAGGAARAISVELAKMKVSHITIANMNKSRGEKLVSLLNRCTSVDADFVLWDSKIHIPNNTDILVNATPVGFINRDEKPYIEYDDIKEKMIVCDVIPNRKHTLFLDEAKNRNCKIFNGMQMLVNQGAKAFEIWTKIKAPVDIMQEKIEDAYKE